MKESIPKILLSPLFLVTLFLLLLNDFVLKAQFHNFLTGKISDFAGLFVFALFFIAFLPNRKLIILISIAIIFIFWKSPYSENLISFWNSFGILPIWRVVDYTDLFALSVLPLAYFYSNYCYGKYEINFPLKQFTTSLVVLISLFAFMATSMADEKGLSVGKNYELNLTKLQFETFLKQNNKIKDLEIRVSTDVFPANQYPNVETDPKESFVNFSLKYKICDSSEPKISLMIKEVGKKIIIEVPSIRFRCQSFAGENSNAAIKDYEPIVKSIFEIEVIDKLKEYSAQQKP